MGKKGKCYNVLNGLKYELAVWVKVPLYVGGYLT